MSPSITKSSPGKKKYFGIHDSRRIREQGTNAKPTEGTLEATKKREEYNRKKRESYRINSNRINEKRRKKYQERTNDPAFREKQKQYRIKNKDVINKRRRERSRAQKDSVNEDQQKRHRIRKLRLLQQKKNKKNYTAHRTEILIQQKTYKQKLIMDQFHLLVEHSSELLNVLKKEANKIVPVMSNQSFRLWLGYIAGDAHKFNAFKKTGEKGRQELPHIEMKDVDDGDNNLSLRDHRHFHSTLPGDRNTEKGLQKQSFVSIGS